MRCSRWLIVDWDGGEPILSEVVEFQGWDTAKEDTPRSVA